jgi:predicted regulator of Ras-like GTPase activity (Roadblock/LC7/MglB family)
MQEQPPAPSVRTELVEKTAEEIRVTTRQAQPVPLQPVPIQPEITADEVEPPVAAVPVSLGAAVPVKSVPPVPVRPQSVVSDRPLVPQPAVLEDPDIKIIGQIKKLNGIVAISVFNEDRNILLMGDVEIEPLLKIARTMLATANKITPHLDWGSFVHMTLQIPEGNVIIAPYNEKHLCILTTRTINIGHIRRILRDLQQDRNQGDLL